MLLRTNNPKTDTTMTPDLPPVLPGHLPTFPPPPEGFSHWEYRGIYWVARNVTFAILEDGVDRDWLIQYGSEAYGSFFHYIEAIPIARANGIGGEDSSTGDDERFFRESPPAPCESESPNPDEGEVLRNRLDWPTGVFRVMDEPGEHDPCWLIDPNGHMYSFNAHAVNGYDQSRAHWIADTLNRELKHPIQLESDLAAARAENDRLAGCLKKANSNFADYERLWYLRGDEIERLRAALEEAIKLIKDQYQWEPITAESRETDEQYFGARRNMPNDMVELDNQTGIPPEEMADNLKRLEAAIAPASSGKGER